ncbi:hypothetical protein [Endomicrobium proavitum]|uniref:hypothetical protein n=1 Tax=Endomicrobium proavitum TaxID=1408281 RepID=UPI00130EABA1|nr:hypothetical protein [Endomicrobium proavitum]
MKKEITEKDFVKIIRNWVTKSYGKTEAINPSWNIKALSKEIITILKRHEF